MPLRQESCFHVYCVSTEFWQRLGKQRLLNVLCKFVQITSASRLLSECSTCSAFFPVAITSHVTTQSCTMHIAHHPWHRHVEKYPCDLRFWNPPRLVCVPLRCWIRFCTYCSVAFFLHSDSHLSFSLPVSVPPFLSFPPFFNIQPCTHDSQSCVAVRQVEQAPRPAPGTLEAALETNIDEIDPDPNVIVPKKISTYDAIKDIILYDLLFLFYIVLQIVGTIYSFISFKWSEGRVVGRISFCVEKGQCTGLGTLSLVPLCLISASCHPLLQESLVGERPVWLCMMLLHRLLSLFLRWSVSRRNPVSVVWLSALRWCWCGWLRFTEVDVKARCDGTQLFG